MPEKDLARRAVVTGLGAVTPIGNDHPTFWNNLIAGVSGVGPITRFDASGFDVRIAAEVKDFDPTMAMAYHLFYISTAATGVPDEVRYGTALVLITMVLLMNAASIAFRARLRGRKKW